MMVIIIMIIKSSVYLALFHYILVLKALSSILLSWSLDSNPQFQCSFFTPWGAVQQGSCILMYTSYMYIQPQYALHPSRYPFIHLGGEEQM